MDDLIYVEGPSLENFCADHAIHLWLEDCPTSRRPHQGARKPYRVREKKDGPSSSKDVSGDQDEEDNDSDDDEPKFTLDKWDQWFLSSEDSDVSDSDF